MNKKAFHWLGKACLWCVMCWKIFLRISISWGSISLYFLNFMQLSQLTKDVEEGKQWVKKPWNNRVLCNLKCIICLYKHSLSCAFNYLNFCIHKTFRTYFHKINSIRIFATQERIVLYLIPVFCTKTYFLWLWHTNPFITVTDEGKQAFYLKTKFLWNWYQIIDYSIPCILSAWTVTRNMSYIQFHSIYFLIDFGNRYQQKLLSSVHKQFSQICHCLLILSVHFFPYVEGCYRHCNSVDEIKIGEKKKKKDIYNIILGSHLSLM